MFNQWLLFVWGLLIISDPQPCENGPGHKDQFSFVEAGVQYGWQVSSGTVQAFELVAK